MSQSVTVKGPAIVSNSAGSDTVPAGGTPPTYDLYTMGPLTIVSTAEGASGDNGPAPVRPHK